MGGFNLRFHPYSMALQASAFVSAMVFAGFGFVFVFFLEDAEGFVGGIRAKRVFRTENSANILVLSQIQE